MHDEMQAALAAQPSATAQGATGGHTVEMHGGNYFGGAQIGSVGKIVAGDYYEGDHVTGDKHVYADDSRRKKRKKRDNEQGEQR